MTADPYAPYALGYTHATVAGTKGAEFARARKSQKVGRGSDRSLQFDCVKLKPIVIADHQAAVNTFSDLLHIAGRVLQRRSMPKTRGLTVPRGLMGSSGGQLGMGDGFEAVPTRRSLEGQICPYRGVWASI